MEGVTSVVTYNFYVTDGEIGVNGWRQNDGSRARVNRPGSPGRLALRDIQEINGYTFGIFKWITNQDMEGYNQGYA